MYYKKTLPLKTKGFSSIYEENMHIRQGAT